MFFLRVLITVMLCLAFESVTFSQDNPFQLLSPGENGVVFQKDPCIKNSFRVIFTFSKDLQDFEYDGLQFIEFSNNFKEVLKSSNEGLLSIELQATEVKKIGNRQLQVGYFATKTSENGGGTLLNVPDQIEVQMLDSDFMKVFDSDRNRMLAFEQGDKVKTLIDNSKQRSCHE